MEKVERHREERSDLFDSTKAISDFVMSTKKTSFELLAPTQVLHIRYILLNTKDSSLRSE